MSKHDQHRPQGDEESMSEEQLAEAERASFAALDRLSQEVQQAPPMQLDWERVEARLMTRIAAQSIAWHVRGGPRWKGRALGAKPQ